MTSRGAPGPPSRPYARPYYGLDIETDTTVDGLDPACAGILAVAVATPRGDEVLLGREDRLLADLESLLSSLPPGVLVTWNGSGFDLPFLQARAARWGVPLGLRLAPGPCSGDVTPRVRASWGAHQHLDGYLLYRADVGRALGLSCGLKSVARLAGVAPVEVDRALVHELPRDELARYVASDARLARDLVQRRLPAAAAFVDRCTTGAGDPAGAPPTVTPG